MQSRLLWWQAAAGPLHPPGCPMASRILGWLLVPWTLQLAGGQSVTHTGLPIVASLANSAVSFTCKITYQYTPKFQPFTVSYFHVDLQGRTSRKQPTGCRPASGTENQTYTLDCRVTLRLPNASATGSYYCCLLWPSSTITVTGNSTFILVRDTGYRDPPQSVQKPLLFSFTGLLTALGVLGTALLLWKKGQDAARPSVTLPGSLLALLPLPVLLLCTPPRLQAWGSVLGPPGALTSLDVRDDPTHPQGGPGGHTMVSSVPSQVQRAPGEVSGIQGPHFPDSWSQGAPGEPCLGAPIPHPWPPRAGWLAGERTGIPVVLTRRGTEVPGVTITSDRNGGLQRLQCRGFEDRTPRPARRAAISRLDKPQSPLG
nr:NFAT activation molecule 1 isoform X2 [Marmota flaviventris]